MIPRSQSAPKLFTDFDASRPRLLRTRTTVFTPPDTPVASPQEIREDPFNPFNLDGFFPRTQDWDWIRAEEAEAQSDDEESVNADFSVPPTPGGSHDEQNVDVDVDISGDYDEFAQQVIDGEDKFGMLAFASENLPSLLRLKMPVFERPASPVHVSPLAVDEPLDLDALHVQLRSRRTTAATSDEPEHASIGQLFLCQDDDQPMMEDRGWVRALYSRLTRLIPGEV